MYRPENTNLKTLRATSLDYNCLFWSSEVVLVDVAAVIGIGLTLVDPKREAAYEYGGYRAGAPDYSPYYA